MVCFTNYSQFFYSKLSDDYVFSPLSVDELRSVLLLARKSGFRVRVSGNFHSLNCSNIPSSDEILVSLRHFRCIHELASDVVRVDCGCDLSSLNSFLSSFNYELPVVNGGTASPTVGGFICAGGIGKTTDQEVLGRSSLYGGFWENVREVVLMDGFGDLHVFTPAHPYFRYLFGSRGQFGIFLSCTLKIIVSAPELPFKEFVGPLCLQPNNIAASSFQFSDNRLLWFTGFCDDSQIDQAWQISHSWLKKYQSIIQPVADARWAGPLHDDSLPIGFEYFIKRLTFVPPLIFPRDVSFRAFGIVFLVPTGDPDLNVLLRDCFSAITYSLLENSMHVYSSVENIPCLSSCFECHSASLFEQLKTIRAELHCSDFLNVDWIDSDGFQRRLVSLV